jgi:hypothetical protein
MENNTIEKEKSDKIEKNQGSFQDIEQKDEKTKFYFFKKVGIIDRYNFYEYL